MPVQIEVIARGVIRRGDRVLVCQSVDGGYGYLPGGHVEFDESAAEALAREMLEETGTPCTVGDLLLSTENRFTSHKGKRHHEITLVFSAAVPVDAKVRSLESDLTFEWIRIEDLDRYDLRPAGVRDWLLGLPTAGGGSAIWVSENHKS